MQLHDDCRKWPVPNFFPVWEGTFSRLLPRLRASISNLGVHHAYRTIHFIFRPTRERLSIQIRTRSCGQHLKMAELSTLEYARYHGLTTDYTLLSPFNSDCFSDSSSEYEFDAAQSNDLSFLETPQTPLLDERWHIDSGGAGFLRSVLSILEHSPVRDYPTRRTERRQLRMASPLLSTDPGLDLAKLFPKRGNQSLQTVSLCDFVQLQPSDEIPKAEGRLSWPASDPSLLGRVENSIQHERLGITFEASKILRSITEDNWSHLETPRSRVCSRYTQVSLLSS